MIFRRLELICFWLIAFMFVSAASWPLFSAAPVPLSGLRSFTNHVAAWPMAIFYFAAVAWLTVMCQHSRDWLLVLSGIALCLFVVIGLFVSLPYGLACAFLSGMLRRTASQVAPNNSFKPKPLRGSA